MFELGSPLRFLQHTWFHKGHYKKRRKKENYEFFV